MSEDIYKTVVQYLKTRNNNWHFCYGSKMMTAQDIIKEMERNKEFRKLVLDNVVKTAVDLLKGSE